MLSRDVGIILNDLNRIGLGSNAVFWARNAETGVPCTVAVEVSELGPEETMVGEVQRRISALSVAQAEVPVVRNGDKFIITEGPWTGKYIVSSITLDDGEITAQVQSDTGEFARLAGSRMMEGS